MTNRPPSMKLKSLYVTKFLLEATGVLLVVCAIFSGVLAYALFKGRNGHGLGNMILGGTLMLVGGVGFILPQLWAKLSSSFLLAGAGVWLFFVDAFRWSNLKLDCLLFIPLVLTLWLRSGYNDLQLRRLPNAN